jgi:autotransporter translocation and assembly factor TamB
MGKISGWIRRRWIGCLVAAAALFAGLMLAAAVLLRAYAPALSREGLESALTAGLGRPVRIERVTLSLWLARAVIENLRVEPGPGEGAEPVLRIGRTEVRVGISSLWRRQIVLSTIRLQDVGLRVAGSGRGGSVPPLDIPETVDLGPVTVRIGAVRIERGEVVYRDDARRLGVEARGLDTTVRPARRGVDLDLRLGSLSVRAAGGLETITGIQASGWLHRDLLSVRSLAVRWQDRPIRVMGEIRHPFAAAEVGLRIEGEVDLAQVSRRLETPWPLAGVAEVKADVRGPLNALHASGQVSVPRLAAGPVQAQDVVVRGRGSQADLGLRIGGKVDLAPLADGLNAPWPLTGLAAVDAEVRGAPAALRIAGSVGVPRLAAGPIRAQDVSARGTWSDNVLDLTQISARIFEGTLDGSFRMPPDRLAETRAAFVLRRASVAALETLAPGPLGFRGTLDLKADLEGDPRRPENARGRFRLTANQLTLPGDLNRLGAGTLTAAGTLHGAIAVLDEAVGRWAGGRVRVSGRLDAGGPAGLRFAADADLGVVAPLWNLRDFAGHAAVTGEVNGRWAEPELTGQARAAPVTVAGVALDRLHVPFRFRGTTLTVESATADLGRSRANVSGTLVWDDAGPAAAAGGMRFRADPITVTAQWEDLRRWLPAVAQGSGRLLLAGRADGTPAEWKAEGTLDAAALASHDVRIQDLRAAFGLNQDRVEVSSLRAGINGVPARGSGVWNWNGSGRATAEVGPADLAGIPGVSPDAGLRGMGQARVEAAVGGGTLDASGTVTLQRTVVRDFALGNGSGRFALHGGQLQADLDFPEARLSAMAQGPVDGSRPLAVRLDARELALAPALRGVEKLRSLDVDGTLTAVAEFQVPLSQPAAARGVVTLAPVRLRVAGEEWTDRAPVALRWEADVLTVDRLHLGSRLGDLKVSGLVNPWGALDLQIDGRVPLAVLPAFRPEIRQVAGTATILGRIRGTAGAPRPTGEATIQAATFQLRDRPEIFRDVEARILFSPDGLRLAQATASLGRGQIRASGDLTLDGWRPGAYRITAAGTNVSIAPIEGLQTAWDFDLELAGQADRRLLRGEGRLVQGRYTGQLNLVSLLLSRQSEPAADASPAIPIHVVLLLNNNFRVDTNWARLRIDGRLSLEGTTARPIVLGSLESQEGRITFRKHRWTVTSAAARFADPRRIEPILDVTGRASINQYDVTLHLSGRLNELVFRFSSVPPLKEQELLSLVTVGTTSATAGAAFGEVGQLLAEDILGLATGGFAPETLGVEKTEKNQEVFNIGKQVGEDVRVLYSQALSGASKRVLRIEYQVIGPVLLSGEQDFQGGFAGDILIRLRFR